MNTNIPLISIIIATKNREFYCIEAIKSILSIDSNEFELAIADNSDGVEVKNFIEKINDNRLKYLYNNSPTSSIANFNRALSLATGEYVCMIGDDDGINSEIIEITKWAFKKDIDAFIGSICANYRWEGTGAPDTLFTKMTGSTLTITPFTGKAKIIDIDSALDNFMYNGCTNYADFNLPRLYHGVVKRKYFENLKAETGEYLKGLSPDIYSSLALASKIKKLVFIDYPITIPGVCAASTSITEGQKKSNSKKLEDIPHLKYRGEYIWSKYVPRFYCVQTIWADSGFAALEELNRIDLIKKFNRYCLYGNILYADFTLKKLLYQHIVFDSQANNRNILIEISLTFYFYLKIFIKRNVLYRALNRIQMVLGFKRLDILMNLNDITTAMLALSDNIKQRKINYDFELREIE